MRNDEVYILAIESSCDDTSCAILKNDVVLANITANQKIHEQYGGVIPELASRDHQKNIVPVVDAAIQKAGVKISQISAVSFTKGPGLMGSLLVGASFAKSMAMALQIPLIEVNHMQAHILAHFIKDTNKNTSKTPSFPFLCLTVSVGHTQIVKFHSHLDFELLGETIDDGPGAIVINTARGGCIDEAALADALHAGRLGGAGLDVFAAEPAIHPRLLTAPRTILAPHLGSATTRTRVAMAELCISAVRDVLAGREPANQVRVRA